MRTKKSIVNTAVAFASQFIIMLLGFISRRVLIYSVGVEYLGINGVMTNLLTVFSLAESGLGMAIGYSLYEPLATNDVEKVKSLMRFYRNTYRALAALTAGIGLAFYPFLPFFLKSSTASNTNLIYFLFLFSSVCSYLWSYKITLNSSDQNKYLYTIANTATQILVLVVKVLILYFTENYIVFLTFDIASTLLKNIIFSRILDKRYPYLKDKMVTKLDSATRHKLYTNLKSLFVGKLGYIVSQSSDNLVITSLVSVAAVGLYSNYTTVVSSISGFVTTFSSGVTASMGNLMVSGSKDKIYATFKQIDFINFWLYTFTGACLYCLTEPCIQLWLGSDFLLSKGILLVTVLTYYLKGINSGSNIVKNAAGYYYPDRFVPLMEAILNMIISIVLAMKIGLLGVLLGTLISFVTFSFWTRPYFVYRDIFNRPFAEFVKWEGQQIACSLLVIFATYFVLSTFSISAGIVNFLVKGLLATAVSNAMLVLLYFRTPEFKYITAMAASLARKLHLIR